MDDEKVEKVENKYYCECCHYKCFRKEHFKKHLATAKHKKMEISKNMIILDDEKVEKVEKVKNEEFVCICAQKFVVVHFDPYLRMETFAQIKYMEKSMFL